MAKYISFIFSAGIVLAFCFLATTEISAQTSQKEDTSATTTVTTESEDSSAKPYVKGITAMRARALIGVAFGVISVVVAGKAWARAKAGVGNKGRNGAVLALWLGAIAIVLSIIHLSITAGAVFGSGSGKAGAIFASVLSLIGMTLSGLVLRQNKV